MKAIKMETEVLTRARRIVVINRFMKEKLLQRYKFLSHEDITIIPHGFDEQDFAPYRHLSPDPNYFTITHSGLFPDDLTPKYFLKALSIYLKKNQEAKHKIRAVFVGLMRKPHEKLVKKYNLGENVVLKGYLPHSECIKELMQSDILWMMSPNNIVTPSRLYEYIGARKPILISIPNGNIKQQQHGKQKPPSQQSHATQSNNRSIDTYFEMWKKGSLPSQIIKTVRIRTPIFNKMLARELLFSWQLIMW
jgi:glycosyltransferase involved in cell wall biosynthesis